MSWTFLQRTLAYLRVCEQSTGPTVLRHHAEELWNRQLSDLPPVCLWEMLRGPVRQCHEPRAMWAVPDENVLYVDLLGTDVLTGRELRQRHFEHLQRRTVTWCILHACAQTCLALLLLLPLHGGGYELGALFVEQDQLLQPPPYLHEMLLLALIAFADCRGCELRVRRHPDWLPLMTLSLALCLFMQEPGCGLLLVRAPISEVVVGQSFFLTAVRQLRAAVRVLPRETLTSRSTAADPPGTPEATAT